MIKKRIIEMENTYWCEKGTYQELSDKLWELVPGRGTVVKPWKNKALERFRKASGAYYDVFNNGGCNRMQSISKLFGTEVSYTLRNRRPSWEYIYKYTEPKMDAIIIEAAKEQGFI
jgi:hypothetical protein